MELICPVCGKELVISGRSFVCRGKHSFDIAKEGYVNLLCGKKSGDTTGDNKLMAHARSALLNKGYYSALANGVADILSEINPKNILDICCGEGYYAEQVASRTGAEVYGFDLSKEMIRLAAKRGGKGIFFVANLAAIPVRSGSFDAAMHLFAPINAEEFRRVLKKGGHLLSVMPGEKHLWGMKEVLYDRPYANDETPPEIKGFRLVGTKRISDRIVLQCHDDIKALFEMTPYLYRTPREGIERLMQLETLETEIEFIINDFVVY